MLRRKPTAITVTAEDIIAFTENRQKKLDAAAKNSGQPMSGAAADALYRRQSVAGTLDPNDELKPLPGDKARIVRSREERIGFGRTG